MSRREWKNMVRCPKEGDWISSRNCIKCEYQKSIFPDGAVECSFKKSKDEGGDG